MLLASKSNLNPEKLTVKDLEEMMDQMKEIIMSKLNNYDEQLKEMTLEIKKLNEEKNSLKETLKKNNIKQDKAERSDDSLKTRSDFQTARSDGPINRKDRAQITLLKDEIEGLQEEITDLEVTKKKLKKEVRSLKDQNEELEEDVNDLNEKIQKLETENKKLKKQIKDKGN